MKYLSVAEAFFEREQLERKLDKFIPPGSQDLRIRYILEIFTTDPNFPDRPFASDRDPLSMFSHRVIDAEVYQKAKDVFKQHIADYELRNGTITSFADVIQCFTKVWNELYANYISATGLYHTIAMASNYALGEALRNVPPEEFTVVHAAMFGQYRKSCLEWQRRSFWDYYGDEQLQQKYKQYLKYLTTETKRELKAVAKTSPLNRENLDYRDLLFAHFNCLRYDIYLNYEEHLEDMTQFIKGLATKQLQAKNPNLSYGQMLDRVAESTEMFYLIQESWFNLFGNTEKIWPSYADIGLPVKTFADWLKEQ